MVPRPVVPAAALLLGLAQGPPAAAQSLPGAAATAPAPICTDRPTKANVACTVPAGAVQVEADLANWMRGTADGVRTDTLLYTNPTVKVGVGDRTDIELTIAPYETVHVRAGGTTDRLGGVGDLYLRLKQGLTAGSSKVQVALIPYLKAPTARVGIGNGRVEGGVIVPVVFSLPGGVALNLGPEVDLLADGDRHGRHAQLVTLANLSRSFGRATVYAEFWNAQNLDPAGTVHQYSADVAVAYLVTPVWQVDVGGNFGLNRATPATQLSVGLATRF